MAAYPDQVGVHEQVEVLGAREHNLKNINVSFPRNQLVVITGISVNVKQLIMIWVLEKSVLSKDRLDGLETFLTKGIPVGSEKG